MPEKSRGKGCRGSFDACRIQELSYMCPYLHVLKCLMMEKTHDGTNLTVTVRSVDTVDIADLYVTASCLLFTLCADAFNTARQSMFVSCF